MKKIFSLLLIVLLFTFTISSNIQVFADEWEQDYKSYTNGIVDGGAYRIKNVETGLYMSLRHELETDKTNIILTNAVSSNDQMFYVNYIGNNRYTFNTYDSNNLMFDMPNSTNKTDLTVTSKNVDSICQRFRIYAVNSSEYNISTDVSSFSSVLYAGYDETNGWHVEQQNVLNLTIAQMKWKFEKVDDRSRDKYTVYYLKDSSTNLYLTVAETINGSHLLLTKFTGGENQRFKKYLLRNDNGSAYYYIPMIKTDMAIEISTSLILTTFEQNTSQMFTETADSAGYFKLSAFVDGVTKYISIGNVFTYNTDIAYYLSSTTKSSFAISFVFEKAYHETPFIFNFDLETPIVKTLTSYSEKHMFIFKPTLSGDYNFFIQRTKGNSGFSIYNQNNIWMPGEVTNYSDGQKYKVTLEKDKIYYIIVTNYNLSGGSYTFYCKKDLLVYIHGMNTNLADKRTDADRRSDCAIPIRDLLNGYDYYDPVINTEADMTSTFVRNVDQSTGVIPLKSDVYIFRGHGSSTSVQYSTGTASSSGIKSYINSSSFYDFNTNKVNFDMTENMFSAWIGCETAKENNNISEAAWRAGSLCSLGFKKSINTNAANKFTENLFKLINEGKTITQAVDKASSGVSFWFTGLDSSIIYGDGSQILKPTIPNTLANMTTNNVVLIDSNILNDYILKYENDRGTLKRYVKFINGYETDDYIDVYYEDKAIVGYYKSKQCYNELTVQATSNFCNLFAAKDNYKVQNRIIDGDIIYNKIMSIKTYDQIYTYEGKIIPVRFYVTTYTNDEGYNYLDLKIINMQTKTEISEDIIYE